ncbi:MAG: hypothetical protein FKGGLIKP_00201 [Sodalis sp. Fse]|nr:MAG: hypothetical protein CMIDDMOC_00481 [Sodalis sp. Fle]UVK77604.1 MAG: hypothetical protein FKGGLIKP_00201 [Sodalis sp. Fse]UVK78861.1 MAG: hypothetical protein IGNPGNKH_00328 [Sodalis sp. Ffu]
MRIHSHHNYAGRVMLSNQAFGHQLLIKIMNIKNRKIGYYLATWEKEISQIKQRSCLVVVHQL